MGVAVCCGLKDLVSEALDLLRWQRPTDLPHVLLQVVVAVLENEVKLVLGVDDFLEPIKLVFNSLIRNEAAKLMITSSLLTYSTMFGCLSPFKREISLIAVLGTPSSSFSSLIFFNATI
jgi:hypothetical protein